MVFGDALLIPYQPLLGNPLQEFVSLKIILLGNGGSGKSSILSACQRDTVLFSYFRAPFTGVDSTIGIAVHDSNALAIETTFRYQVWDFAGQLEYGTIHKVHHVCLRTSFLSHNCLESRVVPYCGPAHNSDFDVQHFLSDSRTLYILVLSLRRELSAQIDYWLKFLTSQLHAVPESLIVVGSKSDLLTKTELEEKQNELMKITKQHKLFPPILVSAATLANISNMKAIIAQIVNQLGSKQMIPGKHFFDLQ